MTPQPAVALVGELLAHGTETLRAAGSASPRLDAELLLAHCLGADRTAVLAHPDAQVGPGQAEAFAAAIARRREGEPVAYIRGVKEFFGQAFAVDPRALIPRPETERLVELALVRITDRLTSAPRPVGTPPLHVADVGTGSGAIAIAVAAVLRRRRYGHAVVFTASDVSAEALELARENAVGHGVADRFRFVRADLLDGLVDGRLDGPFDGALAERPERIDVLVANLPYIPSATVPTLPVAASYEPPIALDGGPDGLDLIRRLLGGLPDVLAPGGLALLEIGAEQAEGARAAAAAALPGAALAVHEDLAGQPRVLEVRT